MLVDRLRSKSFLSIKPTPQLKMETTPRSGKQLLLFLGQTHTAGPTAAESDPSRQRRPLRPTSYQPPLVQCHVDPGRHILTNELFPMVSSMLTSRHNGGGRNGAAAAEMIALAASFSVTGVAARLLGNIE